MNQTTWETIEECAREWKIVELYYRRKKDETIERYELLPMSKRGHLVYFYNPETNQPRAFIENRIQMATKIEDREPLISKEEMPYPVEIGVDEEETRREKLS